MKARQACAPGRHGLRLAALLASFSSAEPCTLFSPSPLGRRGNAVRVLLDFWLDGPLQMMQLPVRRARRRGSGCRAARSRLRLLAGREAPLRPEGKVASGLPSCQSPNGTREQGGEVLLVPRLWPDREPMLTTGDRCTESENVNRGFLLITAIVREKSALGLRREA